MIHNIVFCSQESDIKRGLVSIAGKRKGQWDF
jgi:hypothetical protein